MYSLIPDHLKASTVGDQIASPDLILLTQPTAKSFPSLFYSYLAETPTVGDQIASPDLIFFDTINGKVIPQSIPFIPGRDT